MQVLICDDENTTRLVMRRLIEQQLGWQVLEATNGAEALELLGRERISLVVLDMEMPVMNGLETLEEIRASKLTRELPVIILSGLSDHERILPLMQLGISDYLLKPIQKEAAVGKLQRAVKPVEAAVEALTKPLAQLPAMIVDGDTSFCSLFVEQFRPYGVATPVSTGAAALVEYRRMPVPLVFVGSNLGVVAEERLATKLRQMGTGDLRLVRIVARADDVLPAHFDGRLIRTDVGEILKTRLRAFGLSNAA